MILLDLWFVEVYLGLNFEASKIRGAVLRKIAAF